LEWVNKHVRLNPPLKGTAMSNRGTPSEVSPGQLATVMSRLAIALPRAIEQSELDIKAILQVSGQGVKLAQALAEAFKMVHNGHANLVNPSERHILSIDRTNTEVTFGFYRDRKILEVDERSLRLTEIDLTKVKLLNVLKDGESTISGEERMRRIKATGHIRLDTWILQTILKHPECIPESWRQRKYITFDGTIFWFPGHHEGSGSESEMVLWLLEREKEWKDHESALRRTKFDSCFLSAVLPV
jgi:hypothetical protein